MLHRNGVGLAAVSTVEADPARAWTSGSAALPARESVARAKRRRSSPASSGSDKSIMAQFREGSAEVAAGNLAGSGASDSGSASSSASSDSSATEVRLFFSPPPEKHFEATSDQESHVARARWRAVAICAALLLMLVIATTQEAQRAMLETHWRGASQSAAPPTLPSLNLFDYDARYSYPVFPEQDFPSGLQRRIMPQMPDRRGADAEVWREFRAAVHRQGGSVATEAVDLRFTAPLQSELSGHIVFNVLFGDGGGRIREKLAANADFFAEHIVLMRAPHALQGRRGEAIPAGALLNLDGHHTNEVVKHCARIQHPALRHGYIAADEHICGPGFRTRQAVTVISGLHPLDVIDLALASGASTGHDLIAYAQ